MKKERWDNRMSLWTRLIYGVSDMETWYQQNPTHRNTIRYYTAITYDNELPARYDTYKRSKEYMTKNYPTRFLPEMTYEQIIAIIDSLNTVRPFFSEVFLSHENPAKFPLNFKRNYFDKYYNKRYSFEAYKEDIEMGYHCNLDYALNFFYYWEDKDCIMLFSQFADFHSYHRSPEYLHNMPIFFNPKTFRDYALLCTYFSKSIKEKREKEERRIKQTVLKAQQREEYELRENQIKLLNGLKNDLQSIQDETAKQMKQIVQEDIEITKRLNNNTFLEQLDKTVRERE